MLGVVFGLGLAFLGHIGIGERDAVVGCMMGEKIAGLAVELSRFRRELEHVIMFQEPVRLLPIDHMPEDLRANRDIDGAIVAMPNGKADFACGVDGGVFLGGRHGLVPYTR